MPTANEKTVSLILGSGGARGLAHIGVIRWLEENRFKIKSIVGCSMGAVVGGFYAAGKLDAFERWARSLSKSDIVTLLDFSWKKSGLVRGDKLISTLTGLVGEMLIEDLPISFTAVATDLRAHKEVWIRTGSVFNAMRASFAIPLFFTPFRWKGSELVDGGILNPVPVAPASGDQTDITIAVDANGIVEPPPKTVESSAAPDSPSLREKIRRITSRLRPSKPGDALRDWGAFEIATEAFDTMQCAIARQKLAVYPPDILIEISRNACGTLDFYRAAEMIALGYKKAQMSGLAASAGRR